MEDKFRIRTRSELEQREKGLVELTMIFDELQVPYFLCDGTLLGAVRDGDFIPWDWDTGLCMKLEDFVSKNHTIRRKVLKSGFTVSHIAGRNAKSNFFKYSEKYELTAWRASGQNRVRAGRKMPGYLLDSTDYVELRGRTYPCPSPMVTYLEHMYGDWQTPKVGEDTASHKSMTTRAKIKRNLRRFAPTWALDFWRAAR